MFNVTTEDEADMLKFILGSGFRDQQIRYVEYLDLDFRHHVVRVTAKSKWGFTPKNWEERTVPLPEGLMERYARGKSGSGQGRTISSSAIRRVARTVRWIRS